MLVFFWHLAVGYLTRYSSCQWDLILCRLDGTDYWLVDGFVYGKYNYLGTMVDQRSKTINLFVIM
jgi:hypothetical protein